MPYLKPYTNPITHKFAYTNEPADVNDSLVGNLELETGDDFLLETGFLIALE